MKKPSKRIQHFERKKRERKQLSFGQERAKIAATQLAREHQGNDVPHNAILKASKRYRAPRILIMTALKQAGIKVIPKPRIKVIPKPSKK